MIVQTRQLEQLSPQVTMVDGGFDPLHPGHIAYFRAAARLGSPVLCNVSHDEWIARKHPVLLPQRDRVQLIDAIRYIRYTHAAQVATAHVLRLLRPRTYAKGADWRGRLPDEELQVCEDLGIDIVYLDTVRDSSTEILRRYGNGR